MESRVTTVDADLEEAPPDRREALERLRATLGFTLVGTTMIGSRDAQPSAVG